MSVGDRLAPVTPSPGDARAPLLTAAQELWSSAVFSTIAHRRLTNRWDRANLALVVLGSLFAAAAGASALASLVDIRVAGIVAVVSAVLTGVSATLGAAMKVSAHRGAALEYLKLSWAIKDFYRRAQGETAISNVKTEWRQSLRGTSGL